MNWMEWLFRNELWYSQPQTRMELVLGLQCLAIQRRTIHELRDNMARSV